MTNPTNAYTVPSVSISTARTGASSKANELGMRAMQERAYAKRGEPYLLAPQAPYERTGDVPNVAFPCAALVDGDTGRVAIYYGGADTVVCMAFAYVDEIIDFVKTNNMLSRA